MTASEVIVALQELVKEHGDRVVLVYYDGPGYLVLAGMKVVDDPYIRGIKSTVEKAIELEAFE